MQQYVNLQCVIAKMCESGMIGTDQWKQNKVDIAMSVEWQPNIEAVEISWKITLRSSNNFIMFHAKCINSQIKCYLAGRWFILPPLDLTIQYVKSAT